MTLLLTNYYWMPYDTSHLIDGYSGMIVPNTADLTDLQVGDVKAFFPPLNSCVDCLKIMDVSEHNYGTAKKPCCYHCYLNIETETFNNLTPHEPATTQPQPLYAGTVEPEPIR